MLKNEELLKENRHLKSVYTEILGQKDVAKRLVDEYKKALEEQIRYSTDAFYTMDDEELSTTKTILENEELEVLKREDKLKKLSLLEKSAYFGRIDFNNDEYYIGITGLADDKDLLVYDWRAPVSSMFYDYELGEAKYTAPSGEISGNITKKRQYKVEKDNLVYAFESNLTIGDDILKDVLSSSATEKMKNIVSTIQKDQNKIIRTESDKNMLLQGVAGSGKTSIALHRSAYLLYKNASKLKAEDILIISPNKLFSEYIADVLPELGERNIAQTTLVDLVKNEFPKYKIETRSEMINRVINDKNKIGQINQRYTFDFCNKLNKFLEKFSEKSFIAKDVILGEQKITKEKITELFSETYKTKTVSTKIAWISEYILDELRLPNSLYKRIVEVLSSMFVNRDYVKIYYEFLSSLNINQDTQTRKIFFDDLAGILLVKNYMQGLEINKNVKYLIVDEMQDYNPIFFQILNQVFDCQKLILGDIYQNILVNFDEEYLVNLTKLVDNCDLVKMTKSYRNTFEISKICQKIKGINFQVVDRHGKDVEIFEDKNEIDKIIEILKNSTYGKNAVICKTDDEAKSYYDLLAKRIDVSLAESDINMAENIVISSAGAKGIEFDLVIIPNASEENYKNETDRNLMYISSTRALHELYFTTPTKKTGFLS